MNTQRRRRQTVAEHGPDPIDIFVGNRIRGRRIGLKISQTKLGNVIDVTFQQIQKYENGTNRVGASNLYRIAEALGVNVSFFFEGLTESTSRARGRAGGFADGEQAMLQGDPLSSRESIELMHNFYRINDNQVRRRLFQLVRALSAAHQEGD